VLPVAEFGEREVDQGVAIRHHATLDPRDDSIGIREEACVFDALARVLDCSRCERRDARRIARSA